jgi:hypothetical protein
MYLSIHVQWLILSDFKQIQSFLIDFDKRPNIKFHDNLFSGSHNDTCGHTGIMNLISAFTVYYNMPKMST